MKWIAALIGGLALSLVVATSQASAAVVKVEEDQYGQYIFYVGPVQWGDRWKVLEAIQLNPEVRRIKFSSPGGVADEGYVLGDIMRLYEMQVEVPRGAYCLSACAVAFAGGTSFYIGGILGFHNAWTAQHDMPAIQAMIAGQQIGMKTMQYFMMKGYHVDLPTIISNGTTPARFFVFKDTMDFLAFYAGHGASPYELITQREYDEDYFKEHLLDQEIILDYAVSQRLEDYANASK